VLDSVACPTPPRNLHFDDASSASLFSSSSPPQDLHLGFCARIQARSSLIKIYGISTPFNIMNKPERVLDLEAGLGGSVKSDDHLARSALNEELAAARSNDANPEPDHGKGQENMRSTLDDTINHEVPLPTMPSPSNTTEALQAQQSSLFAGKLAVEDKMFLGLPPALRQPSYSAQESDQTAIRVPNVRFEELEAPQKSISAGNNETIDPLQQPEDLPHGSQAPYFGESSGPISPAVDSLTPNTNQQHSLFECARGTYPEVWYKFKRFETLSLFNLYHYQHELIELEKKITKKDVAAGRMDPEDRELLKRLLKEYRES
jgi:hypothetical protein